MDAWIGLHLRDQRIDPRVLQIPIRRLGWEGFVLLGQPSPKVIRLLDQRYSIPGFSSLQRRRHAGDAPPNHHKVLGKLFFRLEGNQGVHLLDLGDVHTEVVLRSHLGVLVVGREAPDHLLPQSHHLHHYVRWE